MAEAKKKSAAKQVMDVQKPSKVAVEETAKPVIVTNRQILRDPMVTTEATTPVPETKAAPETEPAVEAKADAVPVTVTLGSSKVIEPPKTEEKPEPESPEPEMAEPETPETSETSEPAETKVATPTEAEKPEPAAKPEEATQESEGPIPTEVTTAAAIEAAAEDADAKREAELQKLADKKQYFLPINAMEKRRAAQFTAVGIFMSLILVASWVDVALDASLMSLPFNVPHTHLFDRSSSTAVPGRAVSDPVVTAQQSTASFTAAAAGLKITYPDDWTLNDDSQLPFNNRFTIVPSTDTNQDPTTGNFHISFSNIAGKTVTTSDITLVSVEYTKLTTQIAGKDVYLQELLYATPGGPNIVISSGLVNDNLVKTGDVVHSVDTNFTAPSGKNTLFVIYGSQRPSGKPLTSLKDAQSFMKTADYQKAKKTLLSISAIPN